MISFIKDLTDVERACMVDHALHVGDQVFCEGHLYRVGRVADNGVVTLFTVMTYATGVRWAMVKDCELFWRPVPCGGKSFD